MNAASDIQDQILALAVVRFSGWKVGMPVALT
jgi:hypothetical protein